MDFYSDCNIKPLRGPEQDVKNLKWLLVENTKTALYHPNQFIELANPDSSELRQFINEYVMGRSAEGDILVFYFSGHGVAIGRDDFGFCTTDTVVHPINGVTLPLSVVKFSELLSSIYLANVIPIIIIDACYSGIAGKSLNIPPIEVISNMQHQIHSFEASSCALFCSCSDTQLSTDTPAGGIFSYYLVEVASEGLSSNDGTNKQYLTLTDIYPLLSEKVLKYTGDTIPRLYVGPTLPAFPLVINTQFVVRRYSLSPTYIHILEELWNNGNEQSLSPEQIGKLCGHSAYCNHNKLSFAPWQLLETIPNSRRRRLTERGRQFIRGDIEVPKVVLQDPRTNEVIAAENSEFVEYANFTKKQ